MPAETVVVQAFRPAVSGRPEGLHYVRRFLHTLFSRTAGLSLGLSRRLPGVTSWLSAVPRVVSPTACNLQKLRFQEMPMNSSATGRGTAASKAADRVENVVTTGVNKAGEAANAQRGPAKVADALDTAAEAVDRQGKKLPKPLNGARRWRQRRTGDGS